jgi:hypothetical protein
MNKFSLLVIVLCAGFFSAGAQTNTFPSNGNVGIGTMAPTDKLHVKTTNQSGEIRIGGSNDAGNGRLYIQANLLDNNSYIDVYDGTYKKLSIEASPLILNYFSTGNVGIGTSNPTEKLSVKGKIRAQEVKVEINNWPDFVFAKDYVLPTLQETEKHIKEKGHLPGIPSAAEVEKNGIELGDMNKKLLQKIEELTLYLIEMKKENKTQTLKLQSEIEILKLKIK